MREAYQGQSVSRRPASAAKCGKRPIAPVEEITGSKSHLGSLSPPKSKNLNRPSWNPW